MGGLELLIKLANVNYNGLDIQEQQSEMAGVSSMDLQKTSARALCEYSKNKEVQLSLLEEKYASNIVKLLLSDNQDVRKYIAKTIAYLSLRNGSVIIFLNMIHIYSCYLFFAYIYYIHRPFLVLDDHKSTLLKNGGAAVIVGVIAGKNQPSCDCISKKSFKGTSQSTHFSLTEGKRKDNEIDNDNETQNQDSITISHAVCALANLVCQITCQKLLMSNEMLLPALCRLAIENKDELDVIKHVARGLGNIALYSM